jgi:hypothetical protein
MACLIRTIRHLAQSAVMLCTLVITAAGFLRLCLRSPAALAAENLFLRKQLALYQAHHDKPRRATDAIRVVLVWLSQWFDWQPALAVVHPETFKRWRRQGYHLFWHCAPCPGRPPIPIALQGLIRQMARDNLTWGQRRIANELQLKLGLQVSPRTVRKYMSTRFDRAPGQRVWTSSKACKPCLYASYSSPRGGVVTPSRMRGRGPLRVTLLPCLCCVGPRRHLSRALWTLWR